MSRFSETLRETIEFLEINPVDLSEKSGLSIQTICGLLNGEVQPDHYIDLGLQMAFGTRRGYWLELKD